MSYLFISIIVVIVSFFLFKKVAGTMSLTQLNMISYNYYYSLILQSFIGVNIVILGLDNHYLLNRINDFSIKQTAYFSVVFVMILMPLSMLLTSFVCRFNAKKEWDLYTKREIKHVISANDKAVFVTLIIFTMVSFLSIIYTFISIGTIPLFKALSGTTGEEAARLRIIASREFDGIVYIRNIFGLTMTPILSYIAYSYTVKSNYIGWKILFRILLVLSIFALTYNLAKAPLLVYILGFIFLKVIIKGKINIKGIIKYVVMVIVLIGIFYIFIMNYKERFLDINSGPLGRILLGQITGLYFHFVYFPDVVPFLHGRSFPSFISELFGYESVRSARIVMELVNPRGVELGTAGVMNTLFIGEAYANFGWIGVFFGIIYVGLFIQLMYIIFMRLPKNPITIALFAYYSYSLPLTGGFFDFIYNPGMFITLIIILFFYIIAIIIHHLFVRIKPIDIKKQKEGIGIE